MSKGGWKWHDYTENVCKNCGKIFIVTQSRKGRNFCSRKCGNQYRGNHPEEYKHAYEGRKSNRKGKTFEEFFGAKRGEEIIKKIKDNIPDKSGKNNPFYGRTHSKETINKITSSDGYKKRMSRISKLNTFVLQILNKIGLEKNEDFFVEYYIKTNEGARFVDFFIKKDNLIIEADGNYYHRDEEQDRLRDKEILEVRPESKIIHLRGEDVVYNDNMFKYLQDTLNNISSLPRVSYINNNGGDLIANE